MGIEGGATCKHARVAATATATATGAAAVETSVGGGHSAWFRLRHPLSRALLAGPRKRAQLWQLFVLACGVVGVGYRLLGEPSLCVGEVDNRPRLRAAVAQAAVFDSIVE